MRILVTGVGGQLGHDCAIALKNRGHDVIAPTHSEMDICDRGAVESYFEKNRPEVVVHCAAYTAVDLAEDEPDRCRQVNVDGTRNIADMCRRMDIPMMYFSTDYVFNGTGTEPWRVDDPTDPINTYGLSKRDGEDAVRMLGKHFIIRISWVFGVNGKNFIKTMVNVGKTHDTVRVVNDQIGTPTYTYDLSRLLVDMALSEKYGYYHATNEGGYISWADFATEIMKQAGKETVIKPVTTAEYGLSKAARPYNSRLDKSKLVREGFEPLPTWQDALTRYLKELDKNK